MSWFKKILTKGEGSSKLTEKKGVPEGLWIKCSDCDAVLYRAELDRNLFVCPKCGQHMRMKARKRLEQFLDQDECEELAQEIEPVDRLKFRDSKKYKDRIVAAQKKSGEKSALIVLRGKLLDLPLVVAAFDFEFIGGSMGVAVGEKFVRAVNAALDHQCPLVCFTASGGARMQEGLLSLMQMAKTSMVLAKLAEAKLPYIVVLTDPTTGGVSASLATLGDITVAEPNAIIGFAGARVIKQTVSQQLPEGFQRSEFLLEHGAIDMIVDRRKMRETIARLIANLTHQPIHAQKS